ncbi:MAG: GHKL domain-containing protein [Lachnospiraceae bacterium]|nr:GHKL domain-containing protein [Lachnospiraceae bacterium]
MAERIKRKFMFVVILTFAIVVVILLGVVNLLSLTQIYNKYDTMLNIIADNNGDFPDLKHIKDNANIGFAYRLTDESRFENRYFYVSIETNEQGSESKTTIVNMDVEHISLSEDEVEELTDEVFSLNKHRGTISNYRYFMTTDDNITNIYFIDITSAMQGFMSFLYISLAIAFVSMILVIVISRIVARPVMSPMIDSMEQQKRFITDASHEIKTPLAIISANTDVLELMHGKNEWTESIKNQTVQLDSLIKQLLMLDRLDSVNADEAMVEMNMSEKISEAVKAFDTLAKSKGKTLTYDIEEGVIINGEPNAIAQLASVLIENAIKYATDGSNIEVELRKDGKRAVFSVVNEGEPIDEEELSKLFRRFYRTDTSRTRKTGGFGIGLSIAKSIVDAHKGEIEAFNLTDGRICFRAKI